MQASNDEIKSEAGHSWQSRIPDWLNPFHVDREQIGTELNHFEIKIVLESHLPWFGGIVPGRSKPLLKGRITDAGFALRFLSVWGWPVMMRPTLHGRIVYQDAETLIDVELRLSSMQRIALIATWLFLASGPILFVWAGTLEETLLLWMAILLYYTLQFIVLRWRSRNDWEKWQRILAERLNSHRVYSSDTL